MYIHTDHVIRLNTGVYFWVQYILTKKMSIYNFLKNLRLSSLFLIFYIFSTLIFLKLRILAETCLYMAEEKYGKVLAKYLRCKKIIRQVVRLTIVSNRFNYTFLVNIQNIKLIFKFLTLFLLNCVWLPM